MTTKDVKEEARKKLALNMHQAIVIYTVEFAVFITLVALVVISCVCLGVNTAAAIVMICYGCLLGIIALVGMGMINFALVDFYLVSYRWKPYNIRRVGETLARSNITKIFLLSLKRTLLAILLTLCLIVPGVIYLIRTSMANYLLIANPKMKASAALSASNKVMSGKTGAYFALCASLIGWYVLGVLTLGLGFIFIKPYINLIKTVYYKRNLQGDKTVYVYNIDAPAAPPAYSAPTAAPQPVQAQTPNGQQQMQQPFLQQQTPVNPAPLDTLGEEDIRDMNDAMRDFGNVVDEQSFVPEVPIAPPKKNKTTKTEQSNVFDQISVEPMVVEPVVDEPIAVDPPVAAQDPAPQNAQEPAVPDKKTDNSDIVESERILTTQEIEASREVRNRRIADIYSPSGPKKQNVDYFGGSVKQNRNDFVTSETTVGSDGAAISDITRNKNEEPFIDDFGVSEPEPDKLSDEPFADDSPISDSDFDAFLRDFDSKTEETHNEDAPPAEANTTPPRPSASERASDRPLREPSRPTERQTDRAAQTVRTAERGSIAADRQEKASQQPLDRAERMRREREQRLNNLNKKQ